MSSDYVNAHVIGNIVEECGGPGTWINATNHDGNINAINNIIHDNVNILGYGGGASAAILGVHYGEVTVLHNTVVNNGSTDSEYGGIYITVGNEDMGASFDVTNNIFWNNIGECAAATIKISWGGSYYPTGEISYNDHEYNPSEPPDQPTTQFCFENLSYPKIHFPLDPLVYPSMNHFTGNINVNPEFVNAENDDYHLKRTSELRDNGTDDIENHPGLPNFDIDGEDRPDDLYTDIGADEYWLLSAPAWLWNPATSKTDMVSTDWADSATPGVTYELYEATLSDYSDEQLAYSGTTSAVVLTNRSPGIYYYRVKATKDGYYDSDWTYGTAGGCEVLQPSPAPAFLYVQAVSTTGTIPTDWGMCPAPCTSFTRRPMLDSPTPQ